jgi:hypothetical protein
VTDALDVIKGFGRVAPTREIVESRARTFILIGDVSNGWAVARRKDPGTLNLRSASARRSAT